MKITYLFIIFSTVTLAVFAQQKYTIEGAVLSIKDNATLPYIHVFLEGTTVGTQTDNEGNFRLHNVVKGNYNLVFSMIGFETFVQKIEISDKNIKLKIGLKEDIKSLQEAKVLGSRDKVWEKQYKAFEKAFLGNDINKNEVKVLNKEIMNFNETNGVLTAKANQPIIIENLSLGYKISYILQNFELKKETTSYRGLAHYEPLKAENLVQENNWIKNRKNAYEGSIAHFLKSLLNNTLKEDGFDAYFLNPNFVNKKESSLSFYDITNDRHLAVHPTEIVSQIPDIKELYRIKWKLPMEVVYNKRRVARAVYADAPHPYSLLVPKLTVWVAPNGNLLDPYSIEIKGDMGKRGIAELLPLDFAVDNNIVVK